MKVITAPLDMQQIALELRQAGKRIGLVPTMGFLHEGHLELVKLARAQSDVVVLSIFVNPTQFGPNEDFKKYPRDFERDRVLCETAGVDIIFNPSPEAMYPAAPSTSLRAMAGRPAGYFVEVEPGFLARGLCGASRPGHFRGVLTVVAKLFNLTLPDVAVFGQKDAQQARLIEQMVRDLNFPIAIVRAPIIRERDGLAMSSRNAYLAAAERRAALCLVQALQTAEKLYREGERTAARITAAMKAGIDSVSAARRACQAFRMDYIAIVDLDTLQPVEQLAAPVLVALAVYIGKTRLIDNLVLPDDGLSNLPAHSS
ncbi:MAG: pantoate--beta-alanine ligase [Lentisphaerae bacterium]|nr:pantoate--beta-alanine ligase [Lentisphaerota bacterium]